MEEVQAVLRERKELILEYQKLQKVRKILLNRRKKAASLSKQSVVVLNDVCKNEVLKLFKGGLLSKGIWRVETHSYHYGRELIRLLERMGHAREDQITFEIRSKPIEKKTLEDHIEVYSRRIAKRMSRGFTRDQSGTVRRLLNSDEINWNKLHQEINVVIRDISALIALLESLTFKHEKNRAKFLALLEEMGYRYWGERRDALSSTEIEDFLIDHWDDVVKLHKELAEINESVVKSFFDNDLARCVLLVRAGVTSWKKVITDMPRMLIDVREKAAPSLAHWGMLMVRRGLLKGVISWKEAIWGLTKIAARAGENTEVLLGQDTRISFRSRLDWRVLVHLLSAAPSGHMQMLNNKIHNNFFELTMHPGRGKGYIKLADACGEGILGAYGLVDELKEVKEAKKRIPWKSLISGMVTMAKAIPEDWEPLIKSNFYTDIQLLKPFLNKERWQSFVKQIVDSPQSADKLISCLTKLQGLIEKEVISWDEALQGSAKIAKVKGADDLLATTVSTFKPWISSENWAFFVEFLSYVIKSRQHTREVESLFKSISEEAKPFFLFFMQTRPKQALEAFRFYHLLEGLEIEFSHEEKLFLKIAYPLTLRKGQLTKVKLILSPLRELPARVRRLFLRNLETTVLTFQKDGSTFLQWFKENNSMEYIETFSFVDLVYAYLKYRHNPSVKPIKLMRAIKKLQRYGSNCQNKITVLQDLKEADERIEKRRENELEVFNSNLQSICKMFVEPVLSLYTTYSKNTLIDHLQQLFPVRVKHIVKKIKDQSLHNALLLRGLLKEKDSFTVPLLDELIKNYLQDKTYPLTKRIWQSYPWTHSKNQAWLRKNISNKWWAKNFRKVYETSSEDVKKTNVAERISNHLADARRILQRLGFESSSFGVAQIEAKYKEIFSKKHRYDSSEIQDLKTQISALKSLQGQQAATTLKVGMKIIIQPEFNPMEILQMGNYVANSCLATTGANSWSAVVNAVEVNKRILWAKDSKGNILARLLIAIDKKKKLLRFPIYYASDMDLNRFFNDYLRDLARKCDFGLNGDKSKVKLLFSERWYSDGVEEIPAED